MTKKELEARRAYMREWNRKHPEKQTEYSIRYWAKKIQESEAKTKAAAESEGAENGNGINETE